MDLGDFTTSETAKVEILHPATLEPLLDDAGAPMWVEVHGSDSNAFRRMMFELRRARATASEEMTYEDSERVALEMLAKATVSWNLQVDGEHPTLSVGQALEVYSRYPWLRDQVDAGIHRRENFLSVASAG